MLEPSEWDVIIEAKRAGRGYLDVLERARGVLPDRHFTVLPADASPADHRMAYLTLGYELFTGIRTFPGRIKPHHLTALYGPPCAHCRKPLRTPAARSCAACGTVRADTSDVDPDACDGARIRLHAWPARSLQDVLSDPLPRFDREPAMIGEEGQIFLAALANVLLIGRRRLSDEQLPELVRMVSQLQNFHLMVLAENTESFLTGDTGDQLPSIGRWCDEIGAARAGAFVRDLLALYPSELQDDVSGREDYLSDLLYEKPGVIQRLELAYWDAPLEIPHRMREYVIAHRDVFERLCESDIE